MSKKTSGEADEADASTAGADTGATTAIGDPYKVLGDIDDTSGGIGVLGHNTASTGATKGVEGRVASSDGYGLYTPDAAKVAGDLEVGSTVRRDSLTVAWCGSQQVPSDTQYELDFAGTLVDEPNAFDTGTDTYTAPSDGHYQLVFNMLFSSSFSTSTTIRAKFLTNGTDTGKAFVAETNTVTGNSYDEGVQRTFSTILPDMNAGDTFQPTIYQDSGNKKHILYDTTGTRFAVRYLGTSLS